jgi:hypothetical protein
MASDRHHAGAASGRESLASAVCAALCGFVLPALGLVVASCGGAAASFPDGAGVAAAQGEWCQAQAKLAGAAGSWEHLGACKATFPSASAAFLAGMTKCFGDRKAAENAPDNSQIMQECTDHVTIQMRFDEAVASGVLKARCERAMRCEKVSAADCKAGIDKLENAQRVLLTNRYNQAALQGIGECLASSSCTDNEDEARNACYKPWDEKLFWFP